MKIHYKSRLSPKWYLYGVFAITRTVMRGGEKLFAERDFSALREFMDKFGKTAVGVSKERCSINPHLNATWFIPKKLTKNYIVLYSHGGGYCVGSDRSHAGISSTIAKILECKVLVFNYRLAPEHNHAAFCEDALSAYQYLIAEGHNPKNIVLAGDSAGGALSLELLIQLREQRLPMPKAAILNCPWLDYETIESANAPLTADPFLQAPAIKTYAEATFPDLTERKAANLIYKKIDNLPPIFLLLGTRDILFPEGKNLADKLIAANNKGETQVWKDMGHVWQGLAPFLPEAKAVTREMAKFIAALP